ncbi:Ser/Thr protein phosphatase family [Zea mays]|uniref:Ser/Thr protein phosphatase family n=1 Tax=Zea mays TaxID=4577 RepID=A0A1D6KS95_MAIZE|nr:Ser/Thr protein phosphatase family [Zea mays]
MTPHLPAVSSSSTTTTSRAAAAAHHLLDAAAAPPSSPHQYRRRRRRRVLGCLRPRAASVRCCAAAARAAEATTRVFVVSDLHTDYPENMEWVRRLPAQVGAGEGRGVDALVVAGDVAETRDNFARTMEVLRERFAAVFYVPGNHDLWLRREGGLYVSVHFLASPTFLDAFLSCAAIFSHLSCLIVIQSFDKEKDVNSVRVPSLEMACKDFHACQWPSDLTNDDEALALYFDKLNDKNHDAIEEVKSSSKHILTFSHFVPSSGQELCPEKRMLYYPYLPKVIGSDFLERRLRDIHSNREDRAACHVFGHTHFCWDSVVDEIRYVQAPLAYPRERKRRMNGEGWLPFCVYRDGFNPEIYPALWSDYYNKNKREPENTQLAPWVASHYAKYHKFH